MDVHPGVTLLDDDVRDAHELFRSLHARPELSMQEHATAAAIEAYLEAIGAETSRCGGTGVVGILRNGDGPVVAFRADTDGLPILEETGLAHASRDTGIDPSGTEVPTMHGCGPTSTSPPPSPPRRPSPRTATRGPARSSSCSSPARRPARAPAPCSPTASGIARRAPR